MSAAGPEEALVDMVSPKDSLQEGDLGMYLMHIRRELQVQRGVCHGQEQKQRAEELNLKPESLSQWFSAEPENADRRLIREEVITLVFLLEHIILK